MSEQLLSLNPDDILIRENIRFSIKPARVERLAEQILADGQVNTPIEVQELPEPEDGKHYVLTVGHYRTEAVRKLNLEQSAGLTLPARVVNTENEAQRILRQVSENNERENMSPMDRAIAMQRLLSAGLTKMDVRNAFPIIGGRKGNKFAPASNAHVNNTLRMLEFPKDIQKKIHEGLIGNDAAYQLSRYPRDKWPAIIEEAEKSRIKGIETDEKEEEKFLKESKAAEVKSAEQSKVQAEYDKVKAVADSSAAVLKEKADAIAPALQATLALDKDTRTAAKERYKAAQAELKSAQDVSEKAAKELAKLEERRKAIADKAEAARKKLEAARNAKGTATPATGVKVGGKDVRKAAKKVGAEPENAKPIPLKDKEKTEAIKSLILLSGTKKPKTRMVGELIIQCFEGHITDGQLQLAVARLVGEEPPVANPAPAAPAKKK